MIQHRFPVKRIFNCSDEDGFLPWVSLMCVSEGLDQTFSDELKSACLIALLRSSTIDKVYMRGLANIGCYAMGTGTLRLIHNTRLLYRSGMESFSLDIGDSSTCMYHLHIFSKRATKHQRPPKFCPSSTSSTTRFTAVEIPIPWWSHGSSKNLLIYTPTKGKMGMHRDRTSKDG